jgi:rhodanese-related sulfurtransferase
MQANKVLVVDVRSADAYKTSHIPGSISAPLTEIDKHFPELKSAKKPIVTYCS